MSLNANDAFQKVLQRINAEKAKNNNVENFQSDWKQPQIDYFVFAKEDHYIPFRLVGLPWEARQNPTDMKLIMFSKILTDKGNFHLPVYWPWIQHKDTGKPIKDPKWFLSRFYEDVMDYTWRKATEEEKKADPSFKGEKIYKYEGTPVFNRVSRNQKEGYGYPQNFYPSPRVVANIIDPLDKEFHQLNKKTKVLCVKVGSKVREDGQVNYYPEYGLPYSVYNDLMENIVTATSGHYDFDIAVKKYEQKKYKVQHCSSIEIPKAIRDRLSDEPMTEEQINYKREDLDELLHVTRYVDLKRNLSNLFKEWDEYAKRDFSDELEELASKEIEEYKTKLEAQKKKDPESTSTQHAVKQPEEQQPNVAPKRGGRNVEKQESKKSYEEMFASTFPGFEKLPEDERVYFNEIFNGFDDSGKPQWKDKDASGTTLTLVPCRGGKFQPQTLNFCSYCSHDLSKDDSICGMDAIHDDINFK